MKQLISAVALVLGLCCFGATTYTYDDGTLTWSYTLSSGKATLTKVEANDSGEITGKLTIPSAINTYTVDSIGARFGTGLGISAIEFPNTIETINYGAFANCTALETLVLPDSLTTIGGTGNSPNYNGAFSGCTSLKSVKFGSGLVTIGNGYNYSSNDNPDYYAYNGAFGNCSSLETVEFGSKLETIGHHAFSECIALKTLDLPDSLQTIGVNAFYHNTSLASVSLGTGLVTIDAYAFANCPELQSIVFAESNTPLLSIYSYAFANAVKLTTLTFSESLKSISYGAFSGCTALEELIFPNSLTTIGGTGNSPNYNGAFSGCTSLKSVKFGSGLVTIGNGYNSSSNNNTDYYAYNGAFGNCSSLETVEFGPKLETIGHHAFSEGIKLKALEFPNSLQTIGVNAFYHNVNLSRVEFGADLRSIGEYAFARCTALATISFAATTYYSLNIGAYAFMNCTYLTTLTLSDAITTINTGAFSGCSLLRRITIPSVLSRVSTNVFKNLDRLNEVAFAGLPPENIENAGLPLDIKVRYSSEYADEWADAIAACGWTNATAYDPNEAMGVIGGDSRYELSNQQSDRSIASITIAGDSAIDAFILTDGKVYDSVLRIVNTADQDVTLSLPSNYTYETFEGADPLTIPANSRNILTITRTEENVFLVSREKLRVIQQ